MSVARAFLSIIVVLNAWVQISAQECGCTECPVQTVDLTPGLIPIVVEGAVSNDLSSATQGVCEVKMTFEHVDMGDMTIDLVSPDGDIVGLIGPFSLCGFTNGNLWEVSFVPCGESAAPDPGMPAVWDNCRFENTFNTNYTGSYYPSSGCLEDIDSGPVNGTWEMRFLDNLLGSFGNIIDLEIVFCDMTGITCETPLCGDTEVQIPSSASVCGDTPIEITELNDPTVFSHRWTTMDGQIISPSTSNSLMTRTPGTYTVVIEGPDPKTGLACSDTADLLITRPSVMAGPDGIIDCNNPAFEITGSTSDVDSVFWVGPDISPGEENILTQIVGIPGMYILNYSEDSSCPVADTLIVQIDTIKPNIALNRNPEISCDDSDVSLSFTSDIPIVDFTWTGPGLTQTQQKSDPLIVNQDGVYALTAFSANGCSRQAEIELNTQLPFSDPMALNEFTCDSTEVELSVGNSDINGFYDFTWSGPGITVINAQEQNPIVTQTGDYILTVLDQRNGCSTSDTIKLKAIEPLFVVLDDEILVELGEEVSIIPFHNKDTSVLETIFWTGQEITCDNCLIQRFRPIESGVYSLELVDEDGCEAEDEVSIRVITGRSVLMPNIFSPNNDARNDVLRAITFNNVALIDDFKVYNRWGGMVYHAQGINPNDATAGWDGMTNGELATEGVYIYLIEYTLIDGSSGQITGDVTLVR